MSTGGTTTLAGLQNIITTSTDIIAVGTGSKIDLPSLISFSDNTNDFNDAKIEVRSGGTVTADKLATLNTVHLYNTSSTLALPAVTSYIGNGNIEVSTGGTTTLAGLQTIVTTSTDIIAAGTGSKIDLPSLISFSDNINDFNDAKIEVRSGGTVTADKLATLNAVHLYNTSSTLELLALTSYSGNNSAQAYNGGLLNLKNLTSIPTGKLSVLADGTNSIVDISSLIVGAASLQIQETNGGKVLKV